MKSLQKIKAGIYKALLDESGIYSILGVVLFSTIFLLSFYLLWIDKHFSVLTTLHQVFIALNFVTSVIFLTAFLGLLHKILKDKKTFTYDDLKCNQKYISFLSLDEANELLLVSIDNNDFDLAILLRDHIKKINKNVSIN